jgi:hypothetical protein
MKCCENITSSLVLLFQKNVGLVDKDHSSTKLGHMIPMWKGKNPIYFGVITIIPFDNLYRRAYFVMHTFLVLLAIVLSVLLRYTDSDYQ